MRVRIPSVAPILHHEQSEPMSYSYEHERHRVFTDQGQRDFLKVRDLFLSELKRTGAVTMSIAFKAVSGDVWHTMANVDRLVELGEIVEIPNTHSKAGQHRIFVKYGMEGI